MSRRLLRMLGMVIVLSPAAAYPQTGKTKPTTATYITKEEVDTVNREGKGWVLDRNIKVVDIGNENFVVSVVRRERTVNGLAADAGTPAAAASAGSGSVTSATKPASCGRQMATTPPGGLNTGITHDVQTEGYLITSGGGTMYTDGYIVNGDYSEAEVNGGTCVGLAYEVTRKTVKPGDIIIVPPGVVHGWLDVPDHVEYLSFRPSPGILTAGWVHPAIRK